jgi:Rod binding domain-containing protein|tara:strand:- start:203 stop:535 length:333 start_codon:yes stop_codon:yes gene_type:complete
MDISDITLIDRPTATLEQTRQSKTNTPEELKAATEQFEAILIRQYLNEAMKPLFEGPLMGTGNGAQIYQHMVTDTLANELSQTSTFGVASLLNMQLTSPELGQNKDELNK